uniref:Carboxypeptidase D, b n=1 Tax=Astyanax mexicanus TaxID=7994 RepID=W5LKU9_ASTMX
MAKICFAMTGIHVLTGIIAFLLVLNRVYGTFEADIEESYSQYYNYTALTRRLWRLVEQFPHICSLSSAGRSVESRELWVLRVTAQPVTSFNIPGRPRVKYVGNMHGDETVSRQVLVYLAEYLLTRYGAEPRVTELVDSTDIYIMPSMNPDGFERAAEEDCGGSAGRGNAKYIDLNRSFPDQFDPSGVPASDAPEVTAVIKWILQKKFVLSGNLHGGSVVASYPFDDSKSHVWSGIYSKSPDDALFQYLARTYAENHPIMRKGKPQCPDDPNVEFKDGITNGAKWYDVQGGMQDFNYLKGNCFEVTFELSCCKYPLASELHTEWNNNREALLAYMEKVHIGVKGFVMDNSGMGLPDANISVAGIDHNITTWIFGDYFRLLLPGTYNITASFPGSIPKTVNNIIVTEGKATSLNFTLKRSSEDVPMSEPLTSPVPTTEYTLTDKSFDSKEASTPEPSIQPQEFRYHSYLDMELFLQKINEAHFTITHLYSVGQSVQGRELYVMEISTNAGIDEPGKPEIMLVGNLNGPDSVGREMLLNLVEYLCSNYGSDAYVTRLVNTTRVHIMPSMNPDGYEMTIKDVTYKNGHITDLSNNFPDQYSEKDFVQPETAAVMDWIKAHSFVLSSSVTGGMIGVKYPGSVESIDKALFKSVAEACLVEYSSLQTSQVCAVPGPLATNVIKHYNSAGSTAGIDMQTWAYWNTDSLGFSIGLSCDLSPRAEDMLTYWKENHRVLLQFIQQVHFSLRGRVTDVLSGQAVSNATIVADGSRHQVHTSSSGHYWRLLAPGTYELQASAPGYTAVSVSVTVSETRVEQVDIGLTREHPPQPEAQLEEEEFQRMLEDLSSAHGLEQLVQSLLPAGTLQYRTYSERSEFLQALTLNFPHITRLYSLGHSWEFRTIWALEISGSPESSRPTEPKMRYVTGVHGNAAVGPELLLEFASVLCINYGGNPTITKLIDRSRIVIVPCVNPDGREVAQEGKCFSTAGFTNAHGMDLDADFLYGSLSVQPETRAMMDLIEGGGFSLSVNLEGGSLLVTYPYDKTTQPAQNEETLKYLASVYANNHPAMHYGFPGCRYGPAIVPGGILRGAEFSSHPGSMKDFCMDVALCPEITVYTGCCLYPPAQQLFSLWEEHRMALFAMLLEMHKGVSGVVRNRKGQPVSNALISVNGSVFVHTDTSGHFHTLLPPGTHQLLVHAQGFQQQLRQVQVSSHQRASPLVIEFTENSSHFGQGVVLAAAISIPTVLLISLLIWHLRSAKFSRLRDGMRWLRGQRDDLQMEAIMSEKSPLRRVFLEESESEDDAFYLEHR